MIWGAAEEKTKRQHRQRYTDRFFCLVPRRVDGYWVWFERVMRSREWFDWEGSSFWVVDSSRYSLTEKQKLRLGVKW